MKDTLIEEGDAFGRLMANAAAGDETGTGAGAGADYRRHAHRAAPAAATRGAVERVEVLIIGAGQAGLSVGYHLKKRGVPFVILDAQQRVGDTWRQRWDSLRLFTSARFDALDGMPFPGDPNRFPTKDEMADYLESYAERFAMPVHSGVRVDRRPGLPIESAWKFYPRYIGNMIGSHLKMARLFWRMFFVER